MKVDRRAALAAAAAFAVVAIVIVVVLVAGRAVPPELPALSPDDHPDAGGRVAYVDRGMEESCVWVADTRSGGHRELWCDPEAPQLSWPEPGRLHLTYWDPPSELVLDAETGEVLFTDDAPEPQRPPTADDGGPVARTSRVDGTLVVELVFPDRSRERILELDAPRGYDLYSPRWSPDDTLLLFDDSAGRTLLVQRDGAEAWVLSAKGQSAVWSPGS